MHPKNSPLDESAIRRALADNMAARLARLIILERTASTNDYLLHRADAQATGFHACLARSQTAGKGRRGCKVWHSPNNGNLYLSVAYYGQGLSGLRSGWLPLVVSIEVAKVLSGEYGIDRLRVKWPNDIYRGKGKLGGVLIESRHDRCVAGLGLNVYSPVDDDWQPGNAWSALIESGPGVRTGRAFDHAHLVARMITALMRAFDRAAEKPEALLADWRRYDLLANREVTVLTKDARRSGIARGLDENGGLRVEHDRNETRVYYSEEVSVRW